MKIYHHDQDGKFISEGAADADPLEPGRWLIPANATTVAPPDHVKGSTRHFIAGGWEYREIPQPEPEPVPLEPVLTYRELRAREYPPIGDQLDSLYHAGIFPADMAEQIKAVKDKYPKTTVANTEESAEGVSASVTP
jgi:hypothetical protein